MNMSDTTQRALILDQLRELRQEVADAETKRAATAESPKRRRLMVRTTTHDNQPATVPLTHWLARRLTGRPMNPALSSTPVQRSIYS